MHTIFINTSKNLIGGHIDVLGMEREFKKLTYFDCPFASWDAQKREYEKCADKIGELIDSHKEINNQFNLIIYVDLLEISEYQQLSYAGTGVVEQVAGYEVLRNMLTRFFVATIYEKLDELGRCPNGKILLLLEQSRRKDASAARNLQENETVSMMDQTKQAQVLQFMGLPTKEELAQLVKDTPKDDLADALWESFARKTSALKVLSPQELYREKIHILHGTLMENRVDQACADLYNAVEKLYESDCNTRAIVSEFYTDRRNGYTNKEMVTKRNLLIQFFLYDCIASDSLLDDTTEQKTAKTVPELSQEQWKSIVELLSNKKKSYVSKENDISGLVESYTKLGLAPTLYKIQSEKFGLDEGGEISGVYAEKTTRGKSEKNKSSEISSTLEEQRGKTTNWFNEKEYETFDTQGHTYTENTELLLSADEYCEKATQLANHHHKFLNKLGLHISRAMSNYAGRSMTNMPAVLRKRSVSVGVEGLESKKNDYKYTTDKTTEEKPLESVLKTSKKSYLSLLIEYLKFSAARTVAMTTIKEQTEWFITRIRQIEESLKMLLTILGILTGVLLFTYLPFVLIQWEAITKNADTLLVALASLALPFVMLGIGYLIAKAWQRRKMRKAWMELIEKSNEAMEANARAVAAYDALMTNHIPALRWIYEYLLDVDFYHDCCLIADAKLKHHRDKLAERIETVGNILEDLECEESYNVSSAQKVDLDYTRAFCEGDNKKFYSIVDEELLKIIHK